ncbi:MAG: PQQ-dependent sugar dehydrogenase, partial [Acidimicrobiia bacterium]|nr:PQQ-dependent sugar dehydrogenase [Acidimicrobiia bacterium]
DDFPTDSSANYAIPSDNPFVGSSAGRDEVWAYGLRNPWRWSFDPVDGYIYIADVGQDRWEEVNVANAAEAGINYGWDILEGTNCFEPSSGCSSVGTHLPVLEYSHSVGRSVTGGYVYRGAAMPDLAGTYFYGDASSGWVRSFRYVDGQVTQQQEWSNLGVGGVWSFGQDGMGELYITTSGAVYKIGP